MVFENVSKKIDFLMQDYIKQIGYDRAIDMFKNISSGKKLRSKLLLKIAGITDDSINLCAIIELIHCASLLHDDVIDDSDIRRGAPSINHMFGSKNAIMLGDILYSKGFFELSKMDSFLAKSISEAVCKISVGELMDVSLSEKFNFDEKKYLDMIYHKTAALIEACTTCAAFLSNKDIGDFASYGKNLGIAFQIVDDVLDVTQDEKKLGKPNLNDFKEGKSTLPYIILYHKFIENSDEISKSRLLKIYKSNITNSDKTFIKDNMVKFDVLKQCRQYIDKYANLAISSVRKYGNKDIIDIVSSLVDREF